MAPAVIRGAVDAVLPSMPERPAARSESPSDEALLSGIALGDEQAAVAFVRRYQHRVFGLALTMLGEASLAEDVAQEALTRVWRHAETFDARRGSVTTWVLAITRNLAIDALRLRRGVPIDPADALWAQLSSTDPAPDDQAATSDGVSRARAALGQLPVDQRRAVVLAVLYGRSASEISRSEQVPLGTAKSRIRIGLAKLRSLAAVEEGS